MEKHISKVRHCETTLQLVRNIIIWLGVYYNNNMIFEGIILD